MQELRLTLERLPKELDGLSIAHLSDLHFTGRIGIEFFEEVVHQTAALRADLIVITGDVLDEIEYLDWFDRTLSKLSAPLGIYFVLGNHDQFTGEAPRLRRALETVGMIDLGSRWKRLERQAAGKSSWPATSCRGSRRRPTWNVARRDRPTTASCEFCCRTPPISSPGPGGGISI